MARSYQPRRGNLTAVDVIEFLVSISPLTDEERSDTLFAQLNLNTSFTEDQSPEMRTAAQIESTGREENRRDNHQHVVCSTCGKISEYHQHLTQETFLTTKEHLDSTNQTHNKDNEHEVITNCSKLKDIVPEARKDAGEHQCNTLDHQKQGPSINDVESLNQGLCREGGLTTSQEISSSGVRMRVPEACASPSLPRICQDDMLPVHSSPGNIGKAKQPIPTASPRHNPASLFLNLLDFAPEEVDGNPDSQALLPIERPPYTASVVPTGISAEGVVLNTVPPHMLGVHRSSSNTTTTAESSALSSVAEQPALAWSDEASKPKLQFHQNGTLIFASCDIDSTIDSERFTKLSPQIRSSLAREEAPENMRVLVGIPLVG
ncbi:hypothetical protein CONPUDRAFT_78270 [Coniophora puteana RWD-64-598 SS2]|uniref:Uncharacterized protein n=1 Tax=Coniophora puteana (strain RWD-64-598) TaxID=741705 RepID=R7SED7_CONPW|nr:uncharacterized protein CONPUDRAFT_78270 [Coniophora puteana RWD-64-598 SS2]EIW74112.1 hypothetical protein CONPUDRAFT_78270 [Coniophora puteana RWD-64-598 SS2]